MIWKHTKVKYKYPKIVQKCAVKNFSLCPLAVDTCLWCTVCLQLSSLEKIHQWLSGFVLHSSERRVVFLKCGASETFLGPRSTTGSVATVLPLQIWQTTLCWRTWNASLPVRPRGKVSTGTRFKNSGILQNKEEIYLVVNRLDQNCVNSFGEGLNVKFPHSFS